MVERGKEEEFVCKVDKGTKRIECEGKEEDIGRVKMGDDGFVTEFVTCCFVVCLVYKGCWKKGLKG